MTIVGGRSRSSGGGPWRSSRKLPKVSSPYFPAKQIIPNLWIGSEGDSRNPSFFKQHNIRLVVNATRNIPVTTSPDVRAYRIPVNDDPSENATMLEHFPIVVVVIDDVLNFDKGVLVHCRAGMQRSAAVVAAYLMWKRGYTANQALEFINSRKHETFWPVPTFEQALRAWETTLRAQGRIRTAA
jgi:dual specificity phosphatase 12